jgi:hypothetical protein
MQYTADGKLRPPDWGIPRLALEPVSLRIVRIARVLDTPARGLARRWECGIRSG